MADEATPGPESPDAKSYGQDDDDFEPRDADSHRASYSLTASHRDTPELRPTPGGFVPPAAALSRAPPEGRRLLEV